MAMVTVSWCWRQNRHDAAPRLSTSYRFNLCRSTADDGSNGLEENGHYENVKSHSPVFYKFRLLFREQIALQIDCR